MSQEKNMDDCCKDLISSLPNSLLYQILSNLSTKEAALTSVLSKRWRHLFARVPNLDFDDFSSLHPEIVMPDQTSFIAFVNRVFTLRKKYHINKFSLRCGDGVERMIVFFWISKVLRRGVSDLALYHFPSKRYSLPSEVFVSETLVRLKIETGEGIRIKLKNINVSLTKLKSLHFDSVLFQEADGLAKLLSGCPVLEELVLIISWWDYLEPCLGSIKNLKKLSFCGGHLDEIPQSVSFDTPNVVFLEYSDVIAGKYPKLNFSSLVEARIALRMPPDDQNSNDAYIWDGDEEADIVGNATDLFVGICNVKTLVLAYMTLEVLTFCCEVIPMFKNLTHLTIESNPEVGWESLPDLLKNCPNLETLVFEGLLHNATKRCGDVCLCRDMEISPSCLSSSPVKFLKVLNFGKIGCDEDLVLEIEQIKYFLEEMPNLEQLTIYYNTSIMDYFVEVSSQLEMLREIASLKCNIQVISDNLSLSYTCQLPHELLL